MIQGQYIIAATGAAGVAVRVFSDSAATKRVSLDALGDPAVATMAFISLIAFVVVREQNKFNTQEIAALKENQKQLLATVSAESIEVRQEIHKAIAGHDYSMRQLLQPIVTNLEISRTEVAVIKNHLRLET